MLSLRHSAHRSRLGSLLIVALAVVVLPTAPLPSLYPSLYHEAASHLLTLPDCTACLTGVSAAVSPDAHVAGRPLIPIGIVAATTVIESDSVPASPLGGRSPPPLG